jgi:predicted CXXCH cytochrome family protein
MIVAAAVGALPELPRRLEDGQGRELARPFAAGECTKCHNPHKSRLAKLRLAEAPDLCLTCHGR